MHGSCEDRLPSGKVRKRETINYFMEPALKLWKLSVIRTLTGVFMGRTQLFTEKEAILH